MSTEGKQKDSIIIPERIIEESVKTMPCDIIRAVCLRDVGAQEILERFWKANFWQAYLEWQGNKKDFNGFAAALMRILILSKEKNERKFLESVLKHNRSFNETEVKIFGRFIRILVGLVQKQTVSRVVS